MRPVPDSLAQHLAHWAAAFGADFAPPEGRATARPAAPAPSADAVGNGDAAAIPASTETAAEGVRRGGEQIRDEPSPAIVSQTERETPAGRQGKTSRREEDTRDRKAQVLFLDGATDARAVCAADDRSGRPTDSPAGQLLQRIVISAMGLSIEDVHVAACSERRSKESGAARNLDELIRDVRPDAIVCLGQAAARALLGSTETTTALRDQQHLRGQTPVLVTWHPDDLLRDPARKRDTWQDIKRVNRLLGLPEMPRGA